MISSRKIEELEAAAAEIKRRRWPWFAANAGEPDQADACVAATIERFGGVDMLVNNAATNPYMGPLMGIEPGRSRQDDPGQPARRRSCWTQEAWKASMQRARRA